MGNLIADAQRAATGADAAFTNPGGVRGGLAFGDVTYAGVFRAQPFGGLLVSLTLTGAQIHEVLKQQWCGASSRRVLAPSSTVRYVYSRSGANAIAGKPCAGAPTPVTDLRIHGAAGRSGAVLPDHRQLGAVRGPRRLLGGAAGHGPGRERARHRGARALPQADARRPAAVGTADGSHPPCPVAPAWATIHGGVNA